MPLQPSKCHDCLLFGKECHPTPEQLAQGVDECPDYDPVAVADWLTEDLYPFGIGRPEPDPAPDSDHAQAQDQDQDSDPDPCSGPEMDDPER